MKEMYLFILLCFISILTKAQNTYNFIEEVQCYKEQIKITTNSKMYNDFIDHSTFNIKMYMSFYNTLSIKKKNYKFDYHYLDNFLDAQPYIYIKKKNFNLTKNINKKANKINLKGEERESFIHSSYYYFFKDSSNRASYNVIPEDTEKGYLQYLYFYEFGELFALKWHAGYKYKKVINTKEIMERVVEKYIEKQKYVDSIHNIDGSGPGFEIDTIKLRNLLKVNEFINIELNTDNCTIKWIEIEPFRGIYEKTYKIMRKEPYTIDLINNKELVKIIDTFIF